MNERMEQEIRRTILRLQASMPEPKNRQTSVFTLLRIAARRNKRVACCSGFSWAH